MEDLVLYINIENTMSNIMDIIQYYDVVLNIKIQLIEEAKLISSIENYLYPNDAIKTHSSFLYFLCKSSSIQNATNTMIIQIREKWIMVNLIRMEAIKECFRQKEEESVSSLLYKVHDTKALYEKFYMHFMTNFIKGAVLSDIINDFCATHSVSKLHNHQLLQPSLIKANCPDLKIVRRGPKLLLLRGGGGNKKSCENIDDHNQYYL